MTEYYLPRRRSEIEPIGDDRVLDVSDGIHLHEGEAGLEIELPEGQHLTIGALPPGTILEVISWRGTGSPGAEASRLLLGTASVAAAADDGREVPEAIQVIESMTPATPTASSIGSSNAAMPPASSGRARRFRRAIVPSLMTAALAAALIVGPSLLGLGSWSLVDRGPKWALGSTRGSLVLATDATDVVSGDRVLATPQDSDEAWLGFAVDLPSGGREIRSGAVTLDASAATREVRVIVPWLGYPGLALRAVFGS